MHDDDQELELSVIEHSAKMWQKPAVREWCAKWGMHEYPAFLADCLRVARAARDAGGPWLDALDL